MEAERLRGDIVIALVKIELEGPRIMHDTSRRLMTVYTGSNTTSIMAMLLELLNHPGYKRRSCRYELSQIKEQQWYDIHLG